MRNLTTYILTLALCFSSPNLLSYPSQSNRLSHSQKNIESICENVKKKKDLSFLVGTVTLEFVPFSEFYPKVYEGNIETDKPVETYLKEGPLVMEEKELGIETNSKIGIYEIENFDRFKSLVLEEAKKLGYSVEKIKSLFIHKAVELSAMITASRMKIEKEAEEMDEMEEDKIFEKGVGVCRHYADVNMAVFSVLKSINPRLKNTYISWYAPQDLTRHFLFLHAWNQVVSIVGKNKALVTFIDPTWLDTKGKIDAFDEVHFGKEKCFFFLDLARICEDLAYLAYRQPYSRKNIQKEELYLNQAIEIYSSLKDKENALKPLALERIAFCYSKLGNEEKASQFFDRLFKEHQDRMSSTAFEEYGLLLRELAIKNPERKEELLKKAIKVYEVESERFPVLKEGAKLKIAECYFKLGEIEKAIAICDSIKDEPKTFINEKERASYQKKRYQTFKIKKLK